MSGLPRRLTGVPLPDLAFASSTGARIRLRDLAAGRLVLYVHPRISCPGAPDPPGWNLIPHARGCTAQTCAYRDQAAQLAAVGARIAGLSGHTAERQRQSAQRLRLEFPLLADPDLRLAAVLKLPTFTVAGERLYRRLTLLCRAGTIVRASYPVTSPGDDALRMLAWLRAEAA